MDVETNERLGMSEEFNKVLIFYNLNSTFSSLFFLMIGYCSRLQYKLFDAKLVIFIIFCQGCITHRQVVEIKGQKVFKIPGNAKAITLDQATSMVVNRDNTPLIQFVTNVYAVDGMVLGLRYNPENTSNGKNVQEMNTGVKQMRSLFAKQNNIIDIGVRTFNNQDFFVVNLSNKDYFYLFNSNTSGGGYNVYGGFIRYNSNQQAKAEKLLKDVLTHIKTSGSN